MSELKSVLLLLQIHLNCLWLYVIVYYHDEPLTWTRSCLCGCQHA